jgi:hypothetical protein
MLAADSNRRMIIMSSDLYIKRFTRIFLILSPCVLVIVFCLIAFFFRQSNVNPYETRGGWISYGALFFIPALILLGFLDFMTRLIIGGDALRIWITELIWLGTLMILLFIMFFN